MPRGESGGIGLAGPEQSDAGDQYPHNRQEEGKEPDHIEDVLLVPGQQAHRPQQETDAAHQSEDADPAPQGGGADRDQRGGEDEEPEAETLGLEGTDVQSHEQPEFLVA